MVPTSRARGQSDTAQLTVRPRADHFTITAYPTPVAAGQSFSLTVTVYDSSNNVMTGYTGQVYFTSTDPAAVLPFTSASMYTFTSGDRGVHTFTNAFILKTTGSQTITVTDGTRSTPTSSITVNPAAAYQLVYIYGSGQTLGTSVVSSVITVQRQDQYGNPTTIGSITIQLTRVPASGTFWSGSGGTGAITSRTISSGSSSVSYYYSDTSAGNRLLTASSTGLISAQTTFIITNLASVKIASSFTHSNLITPGSQVKDTAKLVGATADAGGTFTYYLYRGVWQYGTPTLVGSQTVTVTNGIVPDSQSFTLPADDAYAYYFLTEYSGDAKNSQVLPSKPEEFVAWPLPQTILLRPNADTSDNHLGIIPASPTTHYTKIYEASQDGDASYVYGILSDWTDDVYNLQNPTHTGTVSYVTLNAVARTTGVGSMQLSITTHSTDFDGSANPGLEFPLTSGWLEYTTMWRLNPATGRSWTWTEINALQIGCSLYEVSGDARCTQVYVEVYYTP